MNLVENCFDGGTLPAKIGVSGMARNFCTKFSRK